MSDENKWTLNLTISAHARFNVTELTDSFRIDLENLDKVIMGSFAGVSNMPDGHKRGLAREAAKVALKAWLRKMDEEDSSITEEEIAGASAPPTNMPNGGASA